MELSCLGLDGAPRVQRVRKGGFIAASLAAVRRPEQRRLCKACLLERKFDALLVETFRRGQFS